MYRFMNSRLFCTTYVTSSLPCISCQFPRQFCFLGKMKKSSRFGLESAIRSQTAGVDGSSTGISTDPKFHVGKQNRQQKVVGDGSEHPKALTASDPGYEEEFPALSATTSASFKTKRRSRIDLTTSVEQRSEEQPEIIGSSQFEASPVANLRRKEDKSLSPKGFVKKRRSSPIKRHNFHQTRPIYSVDASNADFGNGLLKQRLEERPGKIDSLQFEAPPEANLRNKEDESSLPTSFGKKWLPKSKRHDYHQSQPKYLEGAGKSDFANGMLVHEPFDICLTKIARSSRSNVSLNAKNNEKHITMEHSLEWNGPFLRAGMVLLKNYITLNEQVQIVKKCQELGLGPGGFYQPGYRDGAKLCLQMMCLGLDWDPETRRYQNQRAFDGSEPPAIPGEFSSLVKRAIQDSHALLENKTGASNVEEIPDMSPDICIVNFYTTRGRLGLHQDRDESKESREKGLPVVSFSIGDSADFLYGDQRDVDKAKKVRLESGDVLIFGGKSRHVFHGVSSIIPNSAPPELLEETNIRPGRLNLTFRKY